MSEILKTRHLKRIHGEGGRLTSSTLYADICYTQERLIDYCDIVADSLIKYNQAIRKTDLPDFARMSKAKEQIHKLFKDKYEILHIGEDQDGHIIDLTEQ